MRVLIAGRDGVVRDELTPALESVAWVLNRPGQVKFSLAVTDPKATEENLRPGNRVLIQFANGLPDWGGVLDLPRAWRDGRIECNAYTLEYLLQFRLTDRSTTFDGAPVGAIFRRVLMEMEAVQPEGVELGQVWYGGLPHYPRYHYKSVWQVMESIRRMEQCDIVFQPELRGGRIIFLAHLQERWGTDKSATHALVEGANIAGLTYEEQGPLINSAVCAGAGTTWTNERAVIRAEDAESIQRYGLRERLDVYPDVTYQATLEMHARVRLAQAQPLQRFGLSVLDAPPARFRDYDIGDILLLEASVAWGYRGKIRIIGREFRPSSGDCILAVDAWNEVRQVFIRSEQEGEG